MRRHELNTHFDWKPTRGPYRILSEAQARQYDEQGYFLLEGVFTPQELADVRAAIDPLEEAYEALLREKHGGRQFINKADAITFTVHLVARSAVLKAFSRHRVFSDLCHDIMGPGARLYWDQAVYKKPGNPEEFPWHQDNGYTFMDPQQYLTCWVPLTDATLANGCPWVAPGLHLGGTLAHEPTKLGLQCVDDPPGPVAVPARAGIRRFICTTVIRSLLRAAPVHGGRQCSQCFWAAGAVSPGLSPFVWRSACRSPW